VVGSCPTYFKQGTEVDRKQHPLGRNKNYTKYKMYSTKQDCYKITYARTTATNTVWEQGDEGGKKE
jgi:hypothetical protein